MAHITTMTPAQISEKWAKNLGASTASIRSGVEGVTVAPTEKAAMALPLLLANLTKAIESGKMERALRSVSLQDWQRAMIDKGIARIREGAVKAEPKFTRFMAQLLPHIERVQADVNRTPRGSLEDNIERMVTNVRGMAEFEFEK